MTSALGKYMWMTQYMLLTLETIRKERQMAVPPSRLYAVFIVNHCGHIPAWHPFLLFIVISLHTTSRKYNNNTLY